MNSQGKLLSTYSQSPIRKTNILINIITMYQSRNILGNQCLDSETWTIVGKLLEVQYGQLRERKSPKRTQTSGYLCFLSFTTCGSTRFLQWILENNSLLLLTGGGDKEPFWNTLEYSVLFNNVLPYKELTTLQTAGALQETNWVVREILNGSHLWPSKWEKGSTLLKPTLTILCHQGNWEAYMWTLI